MVDELGNLERAIAYAAERAGISEHSENVRPPRPIGQRLISQLFLFVDACSGRGGRAVAYRTSLTVTLSKMFVLKRARRTARVMVAW